MKFRYHRRLEQSSANLATLGGRYSVRTFLEGDLQIPIYAMPPQQTITAH